MSDSPIKHNMQGWDLRLVIMIYILNFIGYWTAGSTAIVGVIIAHIKSGNVDPLWQSHVSYLLRTFWYGVLMFLIGIALIYIVFLMHPFGIALIHNGSALVVFFLVGLWSFIRNLKGIWRAMEGRAITNPYEYLF